MLTERLSDEELRAARHEIYRGRGYHVFRSYLDPRQAAYVVHHWQGYRGEGSGEHGFDKQRLFYEGCPNYSHEYEGRVVHFNFFWNAPSDLLTYEASWRIQRLRNQIEGRHSSENYIATFPYDPTVTRATPGDRLRGVSYRVVGTRRGGEISPHRDWRSDPSKIQMSLFLTAQGDDYGQGGFLFRSPDDTLTNLCETEHLGAGDLLAFRYNNEHGVAAVESGKGQRGFWRILLPIESISPVRCPAELARESVGSMLRRIWRPLQRSSKATETAVADVPTTTDPFLRNLAELAVEEGCSPADAFLPKGLFARWYAMQDWQVEALRRMGLMPHHRVLDIGCGVLRLGLKLIPYLDEGRYFGTDPMEVYLATGHRLVRELLPSPRAYQLMTDRGCGFEAFGTSFDFAIAHSVFTHMSFEEIRNCFRRLARVMAKGGQFLFTVAVDPAFGRDFEESFLYNADTPMVRSYHADFSLYEALSRELGCSLEIGGPLKHPSQTAAVVRF
jgi:SAM-dependent methyltransferase